MTGVLAVVMVAVALYCLARAFVPALRPVEHRRDLDVWHVAMAAAMALMLAASTPAALALVLAAAFVVALAWALVHLARRVTRAAYARLALGAAAMTAMLVPAATAPAAAQPSATAAAAGHAHHGYADPAAAAGGASTATALPGTVVALLLVLLAVVLVVRAARALGPGGTLPTRLDACCDVAMAAAMAWMLAPLP